MGEFFCAGKASALPPQSVLLGLIQTTEISLTRYASTGLMMSKIVPLPQKPPLQKKVQELFSMDQLLVVHFLSLLDLFVLHVSMYILIMSPVVNLDGIFTYSYRDKLCTR